jgi:serine/threonine-protein kinase
MLAPQRAGQSVARGRYRLVRQIGRGSFGDVYLAEQTAVVGEAQPAVLKILHTQWAQVSQVVERFRRESEVTRRIEHPHVARIFESGALEDGVPFIAMEYLPGPSLREELARGPMELGRGLSVLFPICEALAAAHRVGVVHRDLKPENIILVERNGRRDHPVVLDFGVAKFLDAAERLTMTGAVLGTPAYMSPEQFRGEQNLGPPADVYALGVLAFEVLSGKPPFMGRNFAELAIAHTGQAPPPLAGVPKDVAQVVARALDKEPNRRPKAEDMAKVLRKAAGAAPAPAPTPNLGDTILDAQPPTMVMGETAATMISQAVAEEQRALQQRQRTVRTLLALAVTVLCTALGVLGYFLILRP